RSEAERQKPPQAGSHKSLMFLTETEELFYHKGCKFTYVGVDQTRRRPLAVLLFEIAEKGTTYPKTQGNFKKQNFDLPTRRVGMLRGDKRGGFGLSITPYHQRKNARESLLSLAFSHFFLNITWWKNAASR
ncbi:MAG: hypothetical protein IJW34_06370, partial [Clostridia bacterium]|nr:hypothetical protein [Clostridia bacterium]